MSVIRELSSSLRVIVLSIIFYVVKTSKVSIQLIMMMFAKTMQSLYRLFIQFDKMIKFSVL